MQTSLDIDWSLLAIFSATLLVPLGIDRYFRLELGRDMLISVARMALQLILVGLYLEFVFATNSLWLNLAWLIVMLLVGASAIIGKARLPKKTLYVPVACSLLLSLAPIIALLCGLVIQPTPLYSAQYVIPLAGMLLGNSLSGNIVALQNLYSAFEERRSEYEAAIALAAPPSYACQPFVRVAMQKALAPILASMTTTGLVTLPGMMTGQILGGASPLVAIKYQLVIMIAIFVMMSLSTMLTLQLSLRRTLTPEGRVLVQFLDKTD